MNADRYEAMKELGVPFSVVYKAGDAIVEWEKARDQTAADEAAANANGKLAKAKKAKVAK